MPWDEWPARADVGPVVGDPMVAGALAHPVAVDPDVVVTAPAPVSRDPDIAVARRRNGDHARRRRRDPDLNSDRSRLPGGSPQPRPTRHNQAQCTPPSLHYPPPSPNPPNP